MRGSALPAVATPSVMMMVSLGSTGKTASSAGKMIAAAYESRESTCRLASALTYAPVRAARPLDATQLPDATQRADAAQRTDAAPRPYGAGADHATSSRLSRPPRPPPPPPQH